MDVASKVFELLMELDFSRRVEDVSWEAVDTVETGSKFRLWEREEEEAEVETADDEINVVLE